MINIKNECESVNDLFYGFDKIKFDKLTKKDEKINCKDLTKPEPNKIAIKTYQIVIPFIAILFSCICLLFGFLIIFYNIFYQFKLNKLYFKTTDLNKYNEKF